MASESRRSDSFKLPASSLDEVFKIIQGYANIGKPASLGDISKRTGMHNTVISRNVGFLLSTGIVEGGMNKGATPLGLSLGRAIMHGAEDEERKLLREIVQDSEFLKSVLAAVRIRKGMDQSALRSHIAYSAGQSKTGSTTTGTGAVVELLKRSGELEESDGKLIVASGLTPSPGADIILDGHAIEFKKGGASIAPNVRMSAFTPNAPFTINIDIRVNCEPSDLDGLGDRLRKVIADFSRQDDAEEA